MANQLAPKGRINSSPFWNISIGAIHSYLWRRRPFWLLLSLILAVLLFYAWRKQMPNPIREYFATYRVKYSDPKIVDETHPSPSSLQLSALAEYVPEWKPVSPYDRDAAKKYFESTLLVANAGHQVNYTVSYRSEGRDAYPNRGFDIYFIDSQLTEFDAFSCTAEKEERGIRLSNFKGRFANMGIESAEIFVPIGKETQTPVGLVRINSRKPTNEKAITPIKYKITKISEVEAQSIYDKRMTRYMGGNLIELFLTANCSLEFAKDYFSAIAQEYERYAHESYATELKKYQERLRKALDLVQSDSIRVGAESKLWMTREVERLLQEAQLNALVLDDTAMLETLDNAYIRKPKTNDSPLLYVYLVLFILVVSLPYLLVVLELGVRKLVLSQSYLQELFPFAIRTETVGLLDDESYREFIELDYLRLQIAQVKPTTPDEHQSTNCFVYTSIVEQQGVSLIARTMAKIEALKGKPIAYLKIDNSPAPKDEDYPGIKLIHRPIPITQTDEDGLQKLVADLLQTYSVVVDAPPMNQSICAYGLACIGYPMVIICRPMTVPIAQAKYYASLCEQNQLAPILLWNNY